MLPTADPPSTDILPHGSIEHMNGNSRHDPKKIFAEIVLYKSRNDGNSPSLADLMQACGVSSRSVMAYHLNNLKRQGLIRLTGARQARSIVVIGGEWRFNGAGQ